MATESEAVFRARAKAVGLSDVQVSQLSTAGFRDLGTFAFACAYTPGAADDTPLVDLVTQVAGGTPSAAGLAAYRRLYFEAHTLAAAELRARLERTEDSAPKKLAPAERAHRYANQQSRLTGLELHGPLEPSDSLVDLACQMYEDNRLRYISWEVCTRKDQELLGAKKDTSLCLDSAGRLKVKQGQSSEVAELASDLLIEKALQRRGLALDQAQLVEFRLHERWTLKLFEHRMRQVPHGYAAVTTRQLRAADEALFSKMAELTRDGIQLKNDGSRPLDSAIREAGDAPEVMRHLLPLPSASTHRQEQKRPLENPHRQEPRPQDGGRKRPPPRNVRKPQTQAMPAGLEGGVPKNPEGLPLCFAYNLGACPRPVRSGRCERGLHACCKAGRFQNRPMKQHRD